MSHIVSIAAFAAHPRSRGEHVPDAGHDGGLPGSSPLARGTYTGVSGARCGVRLIPARAGNIHGAMFKGMPVSAHPRSRGEHLGLVPVTI